MSQFKKNPFASDVQISYWGMVCIVLIFGFMASCRQAIYEIVKPAKEQTSDGPDNFKTPETSGQGNQPSGLGPTARVEVIWQGQSVTQVKVNEPTIIRPSVDTLDPDDIGQNCPNPGITKAEYQIEKEASPVVDRGTLCEALSTPYTFKTEGTYLITMTVTTGEGEKASASMTLKVVGANNTDGFGGFTITAKPIVVKVNENVDFNGICTTPAAKTISWKFGDGSDGEGIAASHSYGTTGAFTVRAQCRETDGAKRTWDASLTVVVLKDGTNGGPPPFDPPVPPGSSVPPPPPGPSVPPVPPSGPGKNGGGTSTSTGGTHKKCLFFFHCKK